MRDRLKHMISYAVSKHVWEKHQSHGLLPYSHHLAAVHAEFLRFRDVFVWHKFSDEDLEALEDATWGHDLIEDTGVKYKELAERFGTRVADLIEAVTDEEPSQPRRIRKALTYEKIRRDPLAVGLKLLDRIANVRAGGRLVEMYRKEHDSFERALRTEHQFNPLWDELDHLLNFARPATTPAGEQP